MSFDDTRKNLSALENAGRPIRAEEMYDLLGLVMDDVLSISHAVESSELTCEDKGAFVQAAHYVMSDALKVFQTNREGVQALSVQTQQKINTAIAEAESVQGEIEKTCALINQSEEKQTALAAEKAEAEAKNAHLIQIQSECEALSKRIAELNDSSLEDMAERLQQLKAEASTREAKAKELEAETAQYRKEAEDARTKLNAATADNTAAADEVRTLNEALKKAREDVASTAQKKEELAGILGSLSEQNAALLEYAAQYAETFNAINAAINDPFACENMFLGSDGPDRTQVSAGTPEARENIESPADLKKWMSSTQQNIERLLNVYQGVLRQVVKLGEKLTVPLD